MLREFSKLLSSTGPARGLKLSQRNLTVDQLLHLGVLSSVHCPVIQAAVSTIHFWTGSRSFMDRKTSTVLIPTAIDWIGLYIIFYIRFRLVCLGVS